MRLIPRIFPLALLFTGACKDVEGDDHDHHDHEHEVITTVELTFTPQTGGDAVVATWADREDDGNPVVDDIVLNILDAEVYDLSVSFWNELEDPAEDVTPEIADEADEHQVFFTSSVHKYADPFQ